MTKANTPPANIERIATADLIPYARNARTHSDAQVAQIAASIREFGFTNPVLIADDLTIIAGHGRVMAARKLGLDVVPCLRLSHLSETQRRAYVLADNQLAMNAGWDDDLLAVELADLLADEFDIGLLGFDDDVVAGLLEGGTGDPLAQSVGAIARDFAGIPPFSVLDARSGAWVERKRGWHERRPFLVSDPTRVDLTFDTCSTNPVSARIRQMGTTSMFDPVLAEVAISWFSSPGDLVVDPFAGGACRGVVSADLGRSYFGVDLRQEQIDENRSHGVDGVRWATGDSADHGVWDGVGGASLFMTCPPYFDLEVYSDDGRDLSAMSWDGFRDVYRKCFANAVSACSDDAFGVVVIGDVRDRAGAMRDLVGETVDAVTSAGAVLWNRCVYVVPVASASLRARRPFDGSRKIAMTHQDVLIFAKGDPKAAAARLPMSDSLFPADGDE